MERRSKYTHEVLAPIAAASASLTDVLRALDLRPTGGNYRYIAARLRLAAVDTAHFRGRSWSRGATAATHPGVAASAGARRTADADIFVRNSRYVYPQGLRRRLVARGVLYACAWCRVDTWRGTQLVLHIDHANGINNDNRVGNLRFLCPNCHSQTPTYGNRRR